MSYTAKTFNQSWTFRQDGTDFAAQEGHMLTRGVFGRNADRQWKQREEAAPKETVKEVAAAAAERTSGNEAAASGKSSMGGESGTAGHYVWVAEDGRMAGHATMGGNSGTVASRTAPREEMKTWTKEEFNDRTATLWKRVNPGTMKSYLGLPKSTSHDLHCAHPEDSNKDWHEHKVKTDVSEYVEARARFGAMEKVAGLATGGGGGGDKSSATFRVPGKTPELFDLFPDPGSGDPHVNQKTAITAYGSNQKFWEVVLEKKKY